jgi:streptogramin lyase
MNRLYTLLLLLISTSVISQNISIGEWRDELPYREAIAIGVSDNTVYGVTPFSLFTLNKDDRTMRRYSKINGLSDFGISTLEYSKEKDVVFVAYENTNIDLIKNGNIINISDIKRKQVLGKKTINNVYFDEEIAYLSCGFGIVLIDVVREEVKDTWYIGDQGNTIEVFDITIFNNSIYAATEEGIRKAELNSNNLADFQSWEQIENIPNYEGMFTSIEVQKDKLVVNYHPDNNIDLIYYTTDESSWSLLNTPSNQYTRNICAGDEHLYVVRNYSIELYDDTMGYFRKVYSYEFDDNLLPSDIVEDNGVFWIADRLHGLVRSTNLYNFENYILNGPQTAGVFDMAAKNERLVVASGGRNDSYGNLYKKDGVFTKSDGTWTNFTKYNTPALDTIFDMVSVAINPINTKEYALGSWGKGLSVYNESGLKSVFNTYNSSLTSVIGYPNILRIGGVVYDKNGNLWVNSAGSNALLHKMDPNGVWTAYELGSASVADVGKMSIDSRGYKWIQMRQGGANYVFVFDENQASGQQLKGLNGYPNNGNIPGNTVTAVADDLDGEIWLGTDAGIGVIYNPYAIFNGGDFDAQRIIVERDGYAQYLLEAEKVQAIAVNGANQKWIGTQRAGVFLLSPDGQDEIYHFTAENSPLYSNNITSISITDNGEVFFGTEKGIIAYKEEATPPSIILSDVYAYPNPVRPEYSGAIAIKGLVRDANVKITDIYGGLVHSSQAYGGQAIWDGNNMNGERVRTGVYMVFISDDEGQETLVTKILFVE